MRFPVIARKFPVRLKKFPVPSLREFANIIRQCQHVTGKFEARLGCFCKNSLFFPCLTGNSIFWNERTVRSGLPPPPEGALPESRKGRRTGVVLCAVSAVAILVAVILITIACSSWAARTCAPRTRRSFRKWRPPPAPKARTDPPARPGRPRRPTVCGTVPALPLSVSAYGGRAIPVQANRRRRG